MIDKSRTPDQIAIDRARELGGASRVTAYGRGEYSVLGSDNKTFYRVSVTTTGRYICNCLFGQQGGRCKHKGCVYLYRICRRSLTVVETPVPKFEPWQLDEGGCVYCGHINTHGPKCPVRPAA